MFDKIVIRDSWQDTAKWTTGQSLNTHGVLKIVPAL